MYSFYGGRPGDSFSIVKSYATIDQRDNDVSLQVHYGQYVYIVQNGQIYRKTFSGWKSIGKFGGKRGDQGLQGEPGESAYEIAVRLGLTTASQSEWIASLKGQPGSNGSNGQDGVSLNSIKFIKCYRLKIVRNTSVTPTTYSYTVQIKPPVGGVSPSYSNSITISNSDDYLIDRLSMYVSLLEETDWVSNVHTTPNFSIYAVEYIYTNYNNTSVTDYWYTAFNQLEDIEFLYPNQTQQKYRIKIKYSDNSSKIYEFPFNQITGGRYSQTKPDPEGELVIQDNPVVRIIPHWIGVGQASYTTVGTSEVLKSIQFVLPITALGPNVTNVLLHDTAQTETIGTSVITILKNIFKYDNTTLESPLTNSNTSIQITNAGLLITISFNESVTNTISTKVFVNISLDQLKLKFYNIYQPYQEPQEESQEENNEQQPNNSDDQEDYVVENPDTP